jgi:hypothetical protein
MLHPHSTTAAQVKLILCACSNGGDGYQEGTQERQQGDTIEDLGGTVDCMGHSNCELHAHLNHCVC